MYRLGNNILTLNNKPFYGYGVLPPDINRQLIAFYTFDNTIADSLGLAPNVQHNSKAYYTTGKIGKALMSQYNGLNVVYSTNSYFTSKITGTQPYSISIWIRHINVGTYFSLCNFNSSNSQLAYLRGSSTSANYYDRSATQITNIVATHTINSIFYHWVITFSGTQTNWYLNNNLVKTINETTSINLTQINFFKIHSSNNSQIYVDLLRVYSREITAAEVALLWNDGLGV